MLYSKRKWHIRSLLPHQAIDNKLGCLCKQFITFPGLRNPFCPILFTLKFGVSCSTQKNFRKFFQHVCLKLKGSFSRGSLIREKILSVFSWIGKLFPLNSCMTSPFCSGERYPKSGGQCRSRKVLFRRRRRQLRGGRGCWNLRTGWRRLGLEGRLGWGQYRVRAASRWQLGLVERRHD